MSGGSHFVPFVADVKPKIDDSAKCVIRGDNGRNYVANTNDGAKCLVKEVSFPAFSQVQSPGTTSGSKASYDEKSQPAHDDESVTYKDFVNEFLKYYDIADMPERDIIDPDNIQGSVPACSSDDIVVCRKSLNDARKTKSNRYVLEDAPYAELIALYTTCIGIFGPLNKSLARQTA
eukprot:TRINITY_DN6065_c0_g1_i1.p1 TRINITY_DN6065_c0_g1~~TRINITY_DN6065_c0_g1_i1.p1  ORF type:complete len:176 (-),score=20.66 TRINITY_DN6065_c0_g1_i1:990-1517(-)